MTKYLANENIPMESIRALQEEGFDVRSVKDLLPGAADEEVLKSSLTEERVLLTFDKDFGELIFREKVAEPKGIILLRISPKSVGYITEELKKLFRKEISYEGHFTIVEEGKIRTVCL